MEEEDDDATMRLADSARPPNDAASATIEASLLRLLRPVRFLAFSKTALTRLRTPNRLLLLLLSEDDEEEAE